LPSGKSIVIAIGSGFTMTDERALEQWGGELVRHCAAKLVKCISATGLVMNRSGFGQAIRPAPGSVLASPSVALDRGEPDYFFHWIRDSAAVMDAVRILAKAGEPSADWAALFKEFVQFSLHLRKIDGPHFLGSSEFRAKTSPEMQQYLRPNEEIAAVHGNAVPGEVRYNADGSLDFIRWNRPQHDGPASRALVAMRFEEDGIRIFGETKGRLSELIDTDLAYTAKNAGQRCYDIWEEESARHYYTLLVQVAALEKGAARAERGGMATDATFFSTKARDLRRTLDSFWAPSLGFYMSRQGPGEESPKVLDFAVILGVLHAGLDKGSHSVQDKQVMLTFRKLQELFAAEYAINSAGGHGIMFGRYKGDSYVSGGAYYFSTFGAAEYYYRLAQADPGHRAAAIERGDAILSRVRDFIPASGCLSEQFDQTTGEQTSAKDLSWSYACFITAWHARQMALGQKGLL
jgi:glucoamylase